MFSTLLYITKGKSAELEGDTALRLAREVGSHLSVLLTSVASPPPVGAHMESVSTAWLGERQADQDRLARRSLALDTYFKGRIPSYDIEQAYTEIFNMDNVVGYRARFADAVALGPDIRSFLATRQETCELSSSGPQVGRMKFRAIYAGVIHRW